MHRNHKLKHVVTAALSLIAFGFQNSSFALGLSDIDVRSSLGQQLKAKVTVLGAEDLKDRSCLKLGANSDLSHVNFMLGPLNGNAAALTLTSNKIINEPILNLSIIAGCDSSIKRDYVLLLDPPLSIQALNAQIDDVEDAAIVQKNDTSVESSTAELAQPTRQPVAKARKKTLSSKKSTVNSSKQPKIVAQLSIGSALSHSKLENKPEVETNVSKPRLSISGNSNFTTANTIGLRLDRELKFASDANAPVISENIAIEDEVTVMNNRLAHLQKQIATLQTKNLKLTSENKLTTEQLTQSKSFQSKLASMLPSVGAGLLLSGGGYASFNWLRRRQHQKQTYNTEAIWTGSNEAKSTVAENIFDNLDFGIENSTEDNKLLPSSKDSTFNSTQDEAQTMVIDDEQEFSVLDHADLFLSHGRSTLAIQLLQNHLLEHPKQSVIIWLFLLDLLAKENLKTLYEQTALDCKLHFNVMTSDFSKPETTASESLEDFPRLAQGLESIWNTPAAVVYLDDLIYNNRLEPRAGLAKNLIEELVLLRSMVQENANTAEVIQLDEKKLTMIERKEALLESRKNETSFEFTLVEKF